MFCASVVRETASYVSHTIDPSLLANPLTEVSIQIEWPFIPAKKLTNILALPSLMILIN